MCRRHQGSWGLSLHRGRGGKGVWPHKSELASCTELTGATRRKGWNRAKVRFATFPTTLCTWIPATATSQTEPQRGTRGRTAHWEGATILQFGFPVAQLQRVYFRTTWAAAGIWTLLRSGTSWVCGLFFFFLYPFPISSPVSPTFLRYYHPSLPLHYSLLSFCIRKSPHFHNFQHVEETIRFIKKLKKSLWISTGHVVCIKPLSSSVHSIPVTYLRSRR